MRELLRDFRIRRLLLANITGSVGSGITIIAVPWLLVQRPSGDRLYGYLTVLTTMALFLLVPYYGSWLDRCSRKFALLAAETFGAIISITMAAWIGLTGTTATWQLLVLYTGGMLYYTLHFPAKFAFIQQIFERRHYQQLMGLMEVQGQTASMLSGGLASLMLEHVPFYTIILFDAATYVFSFLVQSTLPYVADHLAAARTTDSAWTSLGEGLRWMRDRPKFTLFVGCTLAPFVAVMTGNYLFPIYVQQILQASAAVYGRGEMVFALGALLAGFVGPSLVQRLTAGHVALGMMAIFVVGLAILGGLQSVAAFYVALLLLGLGNAGTRVARGTLVMHEVPNAIMGRVNVVIFTIDRLLRTLMQFAAIYVVIHANS
ncbi:MAG: MFS transporter, partial [Opitutales bacterium]